MDEILYFVIHFIGMPDNDRKGKNDVLVVRKINKTIYNKFREKALEEHRNVGDALNQGMIEWLQKQDERRKLHKEKLLNLNGMVKTEKTVKWSEDKALISSSSPSRA